MADPYKNNVILSLPIHVDVGPRGSLSLPLVVSSVPVGILAGSSSVCVASGGLAAVWTAVVTLAGVDVSEQVVSEIRIDADEGAARVAEFSLKPPSGAVISLAGWTGQHVTIDVADRRTGSPRYPMRLFSGVIDTPSINLAARTIDLRCTDDLQGRCQAMSRSALAALIGGYESPAVFDAAAIGWAFAQDRLSTVPASLDISPEGQLRLTPWAPKASADLVLDASLIGDGSITPQIADRAGLVNEVLVEFGYRFPRVKAECHAVGFDAVTMLNFAQYILDEHWFLQRAQCVSAIESAGGTVEAITYTPLPTSIIPVGTGYFTPSAADLELCMGFTATVSFDYAQTTEEQHQIRVRNQRSIDAVGLRSETMSGALEGEYPDLTAVESGIKLYKMDVAPTPPIDVAPVVMGETTSVDATLTPETDRAAANAAMEALIAVAKTRIWASHRGSSVSCTVPLMPAIDLDKTIEINADGVHARGKCSRVTHRMDAETGEATTDFTIALCSLAGWGITHDQDPTTAPAGTTATSTPLAESVTVVFNSGPTEDHVLTVTFPEVAAEERDDAAIVLPSTVAAPIVEDLFTLTFQD